MYLLIEFDFFRLLKTTIFSINYLNYFNNYLLCIHFILRQCPQLDRSVIFKSLNYKHCYLFIFYFSDGRGKCFNIQQRKKNTIVS